MESSSSCFICGVNFSVEQSPLLMKRCDSFRNLRELVLCLCELLSVEVTPEDWEGIDGDYLMKQTIACERCFNLLGNVERVHELILKTQRELKFYLEEVESLIIQSESPNLQCSFWTSSCFKLRQSIVNGRKQAPNRNDQHQGHSPNQIDVKREIPEWTIPAIEDPNYFLTAPFDPLHDIPQENEVDTSLPKSLTNISIENTEKWKEPSKNCGVPAEGNVYVPVYPGRRKRKLIVIAEEDLDEEPAQTGSLPSSPDSTLPRKAKKSAEQAIQQSELIFHTEDDDWTCGGDEDDNYNDDLYEDTSQNPFPESEAEDKDKEMKPQSGTRKRAKKPYKKPDIPAFWSFVYAEDNLYLYHLDTFVRQTFTQLQCQAYQCNFQTEGTQFLDFQLMRDHLEQKHRDRKHRQRTPHPCLLCNSLHKNRETFNAHLNASHREKFGVRVRTESVCECCSRIMATKLIRRHMFTHKNAEEKATALATEKVPISARRKLEGTQPKKLFPCPYENCSRVFETFKGIARHKQTHLPRDQRTDLALCPECGKEMLKEMLSTHLKTAHHPEEIDRKLICPFCEKRFMTKDGSTFQAHIRRHKGETPYLCKECGRGFACMASLRSHERIVHEAQEEPVACQWCDAVYTKKKSLRWHVQTKHPDKYEKRWQPSKFYEKEKVRKEDLYGPVQEFPCSECEAIYKFKYTLTLHLKEKHGIMEKSLGSKPKKPRSFYRRPTERFEGGV